MEFKAALQHCTLTRTIWTLPFHRLQRTQLHLRVGGESDFQIKSCKTYRNPSDSWRDASKKSGSALLSQNKSEEKFDCSTAQKNKKPTSSSLESPNWPQKNQPERKHINSIITWLITWPAWSWSWPRYLFNLYFFNICLVFDQIQIVFAKYLGQHDPGLCHNICSICSVFVQHLFSIWPNKNSIC